MHPYLEYDLNNCVQKGAGKAGKYTDYSSVTGITKDEGQSTLHFEASNEEETVYSFLASLDQLMEDIGEFASARQWTRYHLPRNLLLALIGELGEVSKSCLPNDARTKP